MNSRLLIHIAANGNLHWLCLPEGTRGEAVLPEAVRAGQREVVVLVPAEDVLLTTAELPRANPTKLAKVLPFALEDQVLDPVEQLHFALGPRLADGRHVVAVVARERLDEWMHKLRDAGIVADVLLPDVLALPHHADAVSAWLEQDRVLVRNDHGAGFACERAQIAGWLTHADATRNVYLYLPQGSAEGTVTSLFPSDFKLAVQAPVPLMNLFAETLAHAPVAINLLQGERAPRHRHAPQRRLWRIAAVMAVAAIGLGLLGQGVEVLHLRAANAEIETSIDTLYAKAFPNAPAAPDPVARMHSEMQRLGAGASGDGLLPMLGKIAPILASHDSQLVTLGMEYRAGTLELAVRATDVAGLDSLRERLQTIPGMRVEVTAATPGEAGVEGRLRIARGGT